MSVNYDGSNVRFTFGIPRGSDGGQGGQGEPGIQGPPGTNAPNSNVVSTMGQSADSSYNQAQMQALQDKVDELILALRGA